MTQETVRLRSEMADTRDRMSRDIEELRDHAKRRLDVAHLVREHPWPALGAAVVLGAIIGRRGADEKVASAATGAVTGTIDKLRSRGHQASSEPRVVVEPDPKPGIAARFAGLLGATVAGTLDRVIDDLRVASRDWGTRMSTSPARAAGAAVPVAAGVDAAVGDTIATNRAADEVPVPNEMAPAELGLRADAVEAVGGGTHEPPLEPGAGELGARWS
jgi:hypothetical protein